MAREFDAELAEWWRDLVERTEESSLSITECCRGHDVSTASFYKWRRRFREADAERDECDSRRDSGRDADGGFLAVNVTAADERIDQHARVRIVLPRGARVEIPATDRALVLSVVAALAEPAASETQS